jgi:hypothetical protein
MTAAISLPMKPIPLTLRRLLGVIACLIAGRYLLSAIGSPGDGQPSTTTTIQGEASAQGS